MCQAPFQCQGLRGKKTRSLLLQSLHFIIMINIIINITTIVAATTSNCFHRIDSQMKFLKLFTYNTCTKKKKTYQFGFPKYIIKEILYNKSTPLNVSSPEMQRFFLWALQTEKLKVQLSAVTHMQPGFPVLCRRSENTCSAAPTGRTCPLDSEVIP